MKNINKAFVAAGFAFLFATQSPAATLTISPVPTLGNVTSNVGGINCGTGGSSCVSSSITAGTSVTLTAAPTSGGCTFVQWSVTSLGTNTANPLTFPMPSTAQTGVATFHGLAPSITSATSTTFTVGTAGSFNVTGTGCTSPTFSITAGSLPSGVTLATNGTLAGTPAAGTGGSYPVTITASNGTAPNATQSFTLAVNQAPAITSANNATFNIGTANNFTITSTGTPTPTITLSGVLPSGLSFSNATLGQGAIAGTAASGTSGIYPLTITAHNSAPPDATQNFTLTVPKLDQTISFSAITPTVKRPTDGAFAVTASASSSLAVTLTSQSPLICSIISNVVTLTGTAGNCVIAGNQSGDSNYNAASQATWTIAVAPAAQYLVVSSVAAGADFSCALANGAVNCWGSDVSGQVTGGSSLAGIAAIAAGDHHGCAITTAGAVKCFGRSQFGQAGNTSSSNAGTAIDIALGDQAVALALGSDHSCALTAGGAVMCWGRNQLGQLGNGTFGSGATTSPVPVTGLASGVIAISAGGNHTCALMSDGAIKCWGSNLSGELGFSTVSTCSIAGACSTTPAAALATGMIAIAAGGSHTCGIHNTTQEVFCWGDNSYNQAGFLAPTDYHPADANVAADAITAGGAHTCAIQAGALNCWGRNAEGQLGLGTFSTSASGDVVGPGNNVISVVGGADHTCAVNSIGAVLCWGMNADGEIGDGTTANRPVPYRKFSGGDADQVAAGIDFSCALRSAANVACWGIDWLGQVSGASSVFGVVASIATGDHHGCAALSNGAVKCWGSSGFGEAGTFAGSTLGTGALDIAVGEQVVALALGANHSCALTISGAVKCWGRNQHGQLGNGVLVDTNVPVQVTGLASGVIDITAGGDHSCALMAGGGVKCWGSNQYGELGFATASLCNGVQCSITPASSIATGMIALAAGARHTCGIDGSQGVVCWGDNTSGQTGPLGSGNFNPASASVQAQHIAAGGAHTCAISGTGIECWGRNVEGQVGQGTFQASSSAGAVVGLASGIVDVVAGANHTCAVTTDGTTLCWGANNAGQLGDGTTTYTAYPVVVQPPFFTQSLAFNPPSSWLGDLALSASSSPYGFSGGFSTWTSSACSISGNVVTILANRICAVQAMQPTRPGGVLVSPTISRLIVASNPIASTAITDSATGIGSGGAILNGTVSANGTSTAVSFEYGTTLTYGSSVVASQSPLTGSIMAAPVSAPIGALTCGTLYHYRVVGSNSAGVTNGADTTFTTGACTLPNAPGVGSVVAGDGQVTVSFTAPSSDGGSAITLYTATSSPGGVIGTCTTPCVQVTVSGLTNGTSYTFTVKATNGVGTGPASAASASATPKGITATSLLLFPSGPVSFFGDPVTLSASVFASSGIPTGGTVKFKDGSVTIIGCDAVALSSGSAACATSNLPLGTRSLTAEFSGDSAYEPSVSSPQIRAILANNFLLTVSKSGSGSGVVTSSVPGINCGATCSASFNSGTSVNLTATPAIDALFGGWTGCDSVVANICTVTMSAIRNVTVAFKRSGVWRQDFNGDGLPDIVWSNTANGSTYAWHMNGPPPVLIADAFIAQIDPSWRVQGIADFNGDGKPDLVWRNTADGNCYVWYMNGTTLITDAFVFQLPPQWVIQGIADFNGDGHPDFLMRNTDPASGVGFAWYFNNNVPIGDDFLFGIDPTWKVEQVGDLNGDGQPDLLFRSMTSGLAFAWYSQFNGGHLSLAGSSPPIFSIDPSWEIVQLDDWNGDGSPDLLFRNASTGVVFLWYLNGITLTPNSDYVIQIDPSWEIVPRH